MKRRLDHIEESHHLVPKVIKSTPLISDPRTLASFSSEFLGDVLIGIFQYLPEVRQIGLDCALVCSGWFKVIHKMEHSETLWKSVAMRKCFVQFFVYLQRQRDMESSIARIQQHCNVRVHRIWYQAVKTMRDSSYENYFSSAYYVIVKQMGFGMDFAEEYVERNLKALSYDNEKYSMIPFTTRDPHRRHNVNRGKISSEERYQSYDSSIPIGCSKVGGLCDLPVEFPWPKNERAGHNSLSPAHYDFVAQFCLEKVTEVIPSNTPLPTNGMLYFFLLLDCKNGANTDHDVSILYLSRHEIEVKGGLVRKSKPSLSCRGPACPFPLISKNNAAIQYLILPHMVSFPSVKHTPTRFTEYITQYIQRHPKKEEDFEQMKKLLTPLSTLTLIDDTESTLNYLNRVEELNELFPIRIVNCRKCLLPLSDQDIISDMILELLSIRSDTTHVHWVHEESETVLSDPRNYVELFSFCGAEYSLNVNAKVSQWLYFMMKHHLIGRQFHKAVIVQRLQMV